MRHVTTVIIGAGQSGLAMSRHLTDRSIDHVLIERGEVANSWQTERWDSLRLLTPNWQSRLPGYAYDGDDPDGYMSVTEVVGYLKRYADASAPRSTRAQRSRACARWTAATRWQPTRVRGDAGRSSLQAAPVTSRLSRLSRRACRRRSPASRRCSTASRKQLPDGGVMVVGASATGVQLARRDQGLGPKRHSRSR